MTPPPPDQSVISGATQARLKLAAGVLVCAMPVLFILGKATVDIGLSLTGVLFLVRSGLARDWGWARLPWVRVAFGLWLFLAVSSLAADNMEAALGRALPWGRFVIFAAALQVWILADRVWQKRLLVVTGVIVALTALDTFYQLFTGRDVFGFEPINDHRLGGPIADMPPKVGTYIMHFMFPAVVPVIFWALARRREWLPAAAAAGAVCFGLMAVQVSGERTAFLLTLFGLAVAGLLIPGAKRLFAVILVVAGMAVAGTFAVNQTVFERTYQSTVGILAGFGQSHYGNIWRSTLSIAAKNPAIGIGLKNFRTSCADPAYGQMVNVPSRCDLHPHNIYLEWLSETGAIGFAGFMALIVLWSRQAIAGAGRWRHDPLAVGPVVAVIAYLWPLVSTQSFFSNWNAGFFWLLLGWALAVTGKEKTPDA